MFTVRLASVVGDKTSCRDHTGFTKREALEFISQVRDVIRVQRLGRIYVVQHKSK